MKTKLKFDRKVYEITFDEYNDLDTVECEGKFLSTKNKVVKKIVANADDIRYGFIPAGFSKT